MIRRLKERRETEYPCPKPIMGGMKLEKAIRWIRSITKYGTGHDPEEEAKALKLGIEALKGIQVVRELHPEVSPFLLPGETQ